MSYKIIKGTFHVKGYSPDGDSIRFKAINNNNWDFFQWKSATVKKRKKKQLGIEAIDALETHYQGFHQPQAFAIAALEDLLGLLGISNVHYCLSVTKIIKADDEKEGYIACAGLDGFDRPIAFIFDKKVNLKDGDVLTVDQLPLKESINYKLAGNGLVYPTFYSTMETNLVDIFKKVVTKAKRQKRGIWALDRTKEFTLWHTNTIQEDVVILPKLFRRLISFFLAKGDYLELSNYLKNSKDPLTIIETGEDSEFYEIIDIKERKIKMKLPPEEIIFKPKK